MITSLNNKTSSDMRKKYNRLFNSAYNDLVANNKLPNTAARFTDLADYYSHMLDFIEIDKPVYLLLPLDEGQFEINANSRQIKIPDEFEVCGGVTNDNLCEIATFVIDRYFDYIDLAGPNVKIEIQWETAAKKQGTTIISIIDRDTLIADGKLRFGWPLTKEVTETAGPLTFAVKFFIEKTGTTAKPVHVLNTLPATIQIKKGLVLDNKTTTVDLTNELFKSFIINSPGDVSTMPTEVTFANYSWDDTHSEIIDPVTDEAKLYARAKTRDLRDLVYTWFYRKTGSEEAIAIKNLGDEYKDLFTEGVEYIVYERKENEAFPQETFFVQQSGMNYVDYIGNDWPEDSNTKLYVKRSYLAFNPDTKDNLTDITGEYFVKAENIKTITKEGWDDVEGWTDQLISDANTAPCVFSTPNKLAYDASTQFPSAKFIDSSENVSITLEMKVDNKSLVNNPTITHIWSGVDAEGKEIEDLAIDGAADGSVTTCTITTPGIYSLTTSSKLNRYTDTIEPETVCRVTNLPKAVAPSGVYYGFTQTRYNTPNDWHTWIANDIGTAWTSSGDTDVEKGAIRVPQANSYFYLKVTTPNLNALETSGLIYKWYYSSEASNYTSWQEITPALQGDLSLVPRSDIFTIDETNPYIVLFSNWSEDEDFNTVAFKCKITNKIGDKTSAAVESSPIFVIKSFS